MKVWLLDYMDYPESGGGIETSAFASEEDAVACLKARYPSPPNKVRWEQVRGEEGTLTVIGDFSEHVQHHHTQHRAEWQVVGVEVETAIHNETEGA